MKTSLIVVACSVLLFASTVIAQSVPSTPPSDSWSTHPASSSTTFSRDSQSSRQSQNKSHFKFKDRNDLGPINQAPPGANDKAAVMGTDRQWQDGRPPVDCGATPHDPSCH
jgi:hypothetical protein